MMKFITTYTGCRLKRVRLQRTPSSNEQVLFCEGNWVHNFQAQSVLENCGPRVQMVCVNKKILAD